MNRKPEQILSVLDQCCANLTFPMLDNGYVYAAATRLSLYRSETDWGMVIEVFGYSPRAGLPDTQIHTFASALHNRDSRDKYKSLEAYNHYLANNPNNDSRFVFPIAEGDWQDPNSCDLIAENARKIVVRGQVRRLPSPEEYSRYGIELGQPPRMQVFEVCRFLAQVEREQVLATSQERRISILPGMDQVLQLEDWNHPDIVNEERPSESETFQQLAQVLLTGDVLLYRPSRPPNTHWRNWPEGGLL